MSANGHSASPVRQRLMKCVALCCIAFGSASCAYQGGEIHAGRTADGSFNWTAGTLKDLDACRSSLARAPATDAPGLDASNIRIATWNVQKSHSDGWRRDFDQLAGRADLVLMQEAPLVGSRKTDFAYGRHWTFAPGHRVRGGITGVLTLSRSEPLARCSFAAVEPWLRSPKATSIATFRMQESDNTLAVVNVHAVNFTFGVDAYDAQFQLIGDALRDHEGPVILSGDFNTWRGRRLQVVDELARSLGLRAVTFESDHRVRFFGYAVDHIYTRGLEVLQASTRQVDTSDHNPISATLGVRAGPTSSRIMGN